MSTSPIETRFDGDLLWVLINRPEKRNALSPQMLLDLAAAVRTADEHPEVRAVIVHGNGPIFSAGIDIMSLAQSKVEVGDRNPARWLRRFAEDLQQALHAIEATEVPVVGALHGQVMGMGLELALAFDLRVASDDLRLSMPEPRMGLVADVGGTTRLSRTVGPSRTKDLLMTGRSLDAQEALTWGLVNRVVPTGELLDATEALCRQIAQNAPLAVGLTKRIVDQGDGLDRHTQMALERWAQSELIASADAQEAVMAFFEKRPPKFSGK